MQTNQRANLTNQLLLQAPKKDHFIIPLSITHPDRQRDLDMHKNENTFTSKHERQMIQNIYR